MASGNGNDKRGRKQKKRDLSAIDAIGKSPLIDPLADKNLDEVRSIRASLAPQQKGALKALKNNVNTITQQPPNGYYVIVGMGMAAVVNHTTLRQSKYGKERLSLDDEVLPVMHVGLEDPWGNYHAHGMGQPPWLLRMPGYHSPVSRDAGVIRAGLNSRLFAQSTLSELELLEATFDSYRAEAWVAGIESFDKRLKDNTTKLDQLSELGLSRTALEKVLDTQYKESFPAYRLLVIMPDMNAKLIYAHKIDFCSGAGSMRLQPREFTSVPAFFQPASREPWLPPSKWTSEIKQRNVVHGMDGLTEQTEWQSEHRYCIYGSGGIGLNQVERAHDVGNTLDWYSRGSLRATFNLERNDTVLQDHVAWTQANGNFIAPIGPLAPAGLGNLRTAKWNDSFDAALRPYNPYKPYPSNPKWRFAHNCKIETMSPVKMTTKIKGLRVKLLDEDTPMMWDIAGDNGTHTETELDKTSKAFPFSQGYAGLVNTAHADCYNRVILCLGQDQSLIGEPYWLLQDFLGSPVAPIIEIEERRQVALEDPTGDIRIMGAAATMYPGQDSEARFDLLELYMPELPVSAVQPGFILSAVNIAEANGFFSSDAAKTSIENSNINTVTRSEIERRLKALVKGKDDITKIVNILIAGRQSPNNGYYDKTSIVNQLLNQPNIPLDEKIDLTADESQVIADLFELDYGEAKEWEE